MKKDKATKKSTKGTSEKPARAVRAALPFDPADGDLPIGLRRFGVRLDEFQRKLDASRNAPTTSTTGPFERHPHLAQAMPGHRLHKAGGRTPLFLLQALARLERGVRDDADDFEAMLGEIKRLEDTLGDIDYWWAFLENARQKGLPPELRSWASNKHAQACGRLEGWLAAGDWVDHKYLDDEDAVDLRVRRLGALLLAQDWPKPKKERRLVGEYLVERLRKVHEAALALDMDDLEGGLHELRRKLRWFSIYPRALDGLITLDMTARPPAGWDRYLTDAIVGSPFSKLPEAPPGIEPLRMPAPLFYALSWIIDDLGRVKDAAQETELVQSGLQAMKLGGVPKKWLGKGAVSHHEAGAHARAVIEQTLKTDRLLLRLADAFEQQLGG